MNYSRILILLLIVVMKIFMAFSQESASYGEVTLNSVGNGQQLSRNSTTKPTQPTTAVDTLYLSDRYELIEKIELR